MALISCPNCGHRISDKALKCPHCGYRCECKSDHKQSKVIKPLAVFATVLMIVLMINFAGGIFLKYQLKGRWYAYTDSTELQKELVFSNDHIEYSVVSSYTFLNQIIRTMNYKAIGWNKICVNFAGDIYEIHTVDIVDDNGIIISPALTSSDSTEYWHRD